ncbi:MAG TPA: hypothetical protein VIV61_00165, partial [Candidatus Ozemobacteraceae bacterium]
MYLFRTAFLCLLICCLPVIALGNDAPATTTSAIDGMVTSPVGLRSLSLRSAVGPLDEVHVILDMSRLPTQQGWSYFRVGNVA